MTPRERVLRALRFESVDRIPRDLAGMPSTGISCFAYPDLVRHLGLSPRLPRVYDTGQMLALPDLDVLDALGCDVVTATFDMTNAFPQPEYWHPYDFNGRLPAMVHTPESFQTLAGGTILQRGVSKMPPDAYVFDEDHAGQSVDLSADIPKPDLDQVRKAQEKWRVSPAELKQISAFLQRVRESTDRAILFCGPGAGLSIGAYYGIGLFPMLCLTEPDYVTELHEITIQNAIRYLESFLPQIAPYIDVYQCCSDDWGTQAQTIAAPFIFETLFQPYYRRFTDAIHAMGPHVKTFLHSCGAIYDILDNIIACGFDVLNPVQWTAGGHSYQEWKDKCRNRIALWGGGVNTQVTLPLGTVEEVARETAEVTQYLAQDSGYVFCAIHNILAEIPGAKVAAMYQAAGQ